MARSSIRSSRTVKAAAAVAAPAQAQAPGNPSLDQLVAAGAQLAGKELWKAQAAQFCKTYSSPTLTLGFDDLKVGGKYHHAFKAWQALQA